MENLVLSEADLREAADNLRANSKLTKGRAGFVMSFQASSSGNDEKEVRKKAVETGDVDVMISIRGGFFYTRAVPCELWHFDRNQTKDRKDKALMLDARSIGQLMRGSREVYEFTPEQLKNSAERGGGQPKRTSFNKAIDGIRKRVRERRLPGQAGRERDCPRFINVRA